MIKSRIVSGAFSSAHFYHQKNWTEAQNVSEFGKCFTPYGHGHNYRLEVTFQDSPTSWQELKARVFEVTELLDHQHLNFMIPEFKDLVPTTENIARYLLKKLQERCPKERISYIKLYEMDDLWVEIRK